LNRRINFQLRLGHHLLRILHPSIPGGAFSGNVQLTDSAGNDFSSSFFAYSIAPADAELTIFDGQGDVTAVVPIIGYFGKTVIERTVTLMGNTFAMGQSYCRLPSLVHGS
jgi:hypothetical protein